jgi:hypothetical protein
MYGSAAAVAALALLRRAGAPPGARVPLHPDLLAHETAALDDGKIRPLVASPYVAGQNTVALGSANSIEITLAQEIGSGDAIVVCVTTNGYSASLGNNTLTSVSDNVVNGEGESNTYSSVFSAPQVTGSIAGWIYTCVSPVNALPAGSIVTVDFNKGDGAHEAYVIGVPGATQLDTSTSATQALTGTAAPVSVTVTPSVPNETLIVMEANGSTGGAISWTAPFQPLPIYGGGTITMVALSSQSNGKAPAGLMVAGGDVEGYFLTNNGTTANPEPYGWQWSIINNGVYPQYWRQSACIAWSQLESAADGGGVIYSCCGDATSKGGGFLVSTDYGNTWTLRSGASNAQPQFSGNHGANPMPSGGWPRSTGNLLAQDPAGYMYAGSYSHGVYRWDTSLNATPGAKWAAIPFNSSSTSYYVRSVALDPGDPTTLFAATSPYDLPGSPVLDNGYVWVTSGSTSGARSTSPAWTQLTGLPSVVEELFITSTTIYAACGYYGVYYLPLSELATAISTPSHAWSNLNGGLITSIPITTSPPSPPSSSYDDYSYWDSIAAYTNSSGDDVVVVFGDNPQGPGSGGGYYNIVQVVNNGSPDPVTLTGNTSDINVASYPTGGGDMQDWWHGGGSYDDYVGGRVWNNAHLVIDQSVSENSPTIYVSGSNGLYIYNPSPPSGESIWQVTINGLAVFDGRSVAVDPSDSSHIVFGDSDWCSWDLNWNYTTTWPPFTNVPSPNPGTLEGGTYPDSAITNAGALEGFALAFDPGGSNDVYCSTGTKYTSTNGDVVYRPDPTSQGAYTWNNGSGLYTAHSGETDGNIALGLAVLRDSSNQYILAPVDTSGMWLYSSAGGGSWTLVSTAIATSAGQATDTQYMPITGPPTLATSPAGSSCVYVFDRNAGIIFRGTYTTTSPLTSWEAMFNLGGSFSDSRTGYVFLDPTPGNNNLWVSVPSGGTVYPDGALIMIESASTYTYVAADHNQPAAIALPTYESNAVYPGAVVVTYESEVTTVYCIGLGSANSPNTQLFTSTNGGSTWNSIGGGISANASYPTEMAVSPNGDVYVANSGNLVAYSAGTGATTLGTVLHTGDNQYTCAAAQVVSTTAPLTITGSITSGVDWIALVAAFET